TPMLFMGEEWGARTPFQYFTDHAEPELAESIRQGRTREFATHGWTELYGEEVQVPDPQARSTFTASKLDWDEADRPGHTRLLAFYRDLIGLRRTEADIASGVRADTTVRAAEDGGWLVLDRGSMSIAVNLDDTPREVPLRGAVREVLLGWTGEVQAADDTITLPAHDVAVLRH